MQLEIGSEELPPSLEVSTAEDRVAAIAMLQQAFLRPKEDGDRGGGSGASDASFLPLCKHSWDELTSDRAQVAFAFCGLGQLFLRTNRDTAAATCADALGELVCDVRVLGELAVRPGYEKLGAAAFFRRKASQGGEAEDDSDLPRTHLDSLELYVPPLTSTLLNSMYEQSAERVTVRTSTRRTRVGLT